MNCKWLLIGLFLVGWITFGSGSNSECNPIEPRCDNVSMMYLNIQLVKRETINFTAIVIGDSITYKMFLSTQGNLLRNRGVQNGGAPGNTIEQTLCRINSGLLGGGFCPPTIILEIGTNNIIEGCDADTIVIGLLNLIARIQELCPYAKVKLLSIIQRNWANYVYAQGMNAIIESVNRQLLLKYGAHAVSGVSFYYINPLFEIFNSTMGRVYVDPLMIRPDGTHPTELGNQRLINYVLDLLPCEVN